MGLDSYLEIFTTMYGWAFSHIIWDVLRNTGLVYLPLLITLIGTWMQAHEMGEEMGGPAWMVRKMEIELGTAIFVLAFCAMPTSMTSLANASLYFTPPKTTLEPAPVTATGAAPDSSYGAAFANVPTAADVPAWWYTVMGLSSGINAAVKAGVNTGIRDFRQIEELAHTATVEDPLLRGEIQRFYSECFVPARSRYLAAGVASPEAGNAIATYGQADVDWIGSHAFRDDPTLYAALYAGYGVAGFAFDPVRDADMDTSPIQPALGRPTCKEWWEDATNGLRQKMASGVGKVDWLMKSKVDQLFPGVSDEARTDQMARLAVQKASPSYVDPEQIMGDDRSGLSKLMHAPSDMLGIGGIAIGGAVASTTLFALVQFLTISQPLILMAIYMFMPLIVVFSRYSLNMMFMGALAIFTIKFWSVMWFIARWMDDHLIEAMYPGAQGSVLMEAITTKLDGSIKRTTLNIVLLSMYAGLPLIWSGMMAWVGVHIGKGIESVQKDAVNSAHEAGKKGADGPGKIAKTFSKK